MPTAASSSWSWERDRSLPTSSPTSSCFIDLVTVWIDEEDVLAGDSQDGVVD
jgi:hypothetical protein